MVATDLSDNQPECYFCGKALYWGFGEPDYSIEKIRTSSGEVIEDAVCHDCNPKK